MEKIGLSVRCFVDLFGMTAFTPRQCIEWLQKFLVRRALKRDWPGITFPGGHIEPGESFTDAVIREVQEETGLHIRSPQLCGIKDWCENQCRFVVLLYKTTCFDGELHSSSEGRVWWEDIANLPNLKLSLDMRDMLRVFKEENLSEFFYYQESSAWKYVLK